MSLKFNGYNNCIYFFFKFTADKVPARLNIGLMLFLSILFLYVERAHFSINLLAMVQPMMTDENGTIIQLPDVSANNIVDFFPRLQ